LATARYTLEKIHDDITKHGGINQWHEYIQALIVAAKSYWQEASLWKQQVRGFDAANKIHVDKDKKGTDWSHRHTKKNLHDILIELSNLAGQEAKWVQDKPENAARLPEEVKAHTTVTAQCFYKKMSRMNGICTVEDECARFLRNRGREWEVLNQPRHPKNRLEGDDLLRWFHTTPRQR
jgi:hypothetical protein